jgi:hypothetical protein
MYINMTAAYINEYLLILNELKDFLLNEDNDDSIVRNLTTNREYATTSGYNAQFFEATHTCINKMVWKIWAPSSVRFFS